MNIKQALEYGIEQLNKNNIEYVINATDNDREGELIAFLIFLLAKNKKPVKVIPSKALCPECGEPLIFEGGCNSCKNCGYSKCS